MLEILQNDPGQKSHVRGHDLLRCHQRHGLPGKANQDEPVIVNTDGVFQQFFPQLAQLFQGGSPIGQLIDAHFVLLEAGVQFQQEVQQKLCFHIGAADVISLSFQGCGTDIGIVIGGESRLAGTQGVKHILQKGLAAGIKPYVPVHLGRVADGCVNLPAGQYKGFFDDFHSGKQANQLCHVHERHSFEKSYFHYIRKNEESKDGKQHNCGKLVVIF